MRAWLLVNAESGRIDGFCAASHMAETPIDPKGQHVAILVPATHPALSNREAWEAPPLVVYGASWGRRLQRRDQPLRERGFLRER